MNSLLLSKIKSDYPNIKFRQGRKFSFRPPKTIVLGPEEQHDSLLLLHELGHALLGHRDFDTDIKRLKMEREAWEKARELALLYDVEFSDEVAEAELETYRNYLDQKSRCPKCRLTRFQTPDGVYHCPKCDNY